MKQERQQIYKIISIQTISLILLSLIVVVVGSLSAAYSVLLGGICCVLPSLYFAFQLFRNNGARAAYLTVQTLYVGEIIKLLFTGCLCVFVFKFIPIQPLAFFCGFLATQFIFWCAPAVYRFRSSMPRRGIA
jgi:ATP synthase protein I